MVSLNGCSSGGAGTIAEPPPGAVADRVDGDWDDVDAAVEVGAGRAECVIVRQWPAVRARRGPAPAERRYRLKHVSGREGSLVAVLEGAPGTLEPRPVTFRCWMGPVSDGSLERTILARVERRLDDLRGRDVAPIRD